MNQEETYGRMMEASLHTKWPNKKPYHPETIEFWRKVDTILSNPNNTIMLVSILNKDYMDIKRFAYRASNRIASDNETMLARQENHLGGADL